MYDYRNRVYSPELGRFLQTDPKSFDADPTNLYRYCANDPLDHTDPMGLQYSTPMADQELRMSANDHAQPDDSEARLSYAKALSYGVHQIWNAPNHIAGITNNHPVDFNLSMGQDPKQNWNRDIHATVFSGGNDPTDRSNPAFLDRKLRPNESAAALPGGPEMRGKSIDVVYTRTGARQNGIPVVDKGPFFDGTPKRPADRYWNTGTRPLAESTRANKSGLDLSPRVWQNFGFKIQYREGVPYSYSRFDSNPVFDWRWH